MRILLDTQAFLWFVTDDHRLTVAARMAIENEQNQWFLSVASVWEMAIKYSLGKLKFSEPFEQFISEQLALNQLTLFPITLTHAMGVAALPAHHRDPFDRLLVAQAIAEQVGIVSSDEAFDAYGISQIH